MRPKILLIHPPIYDFTAYDFWARPYGLLTVAGLIRHRFEPRLFDFLDRGHPSIPRKQSKTSDAWGRGHFPKERVDAPSCLADVPRRFSRYGLARGMFQKFLVEEGPWDVALIQTGMTYWYLGVKEVLEDLKAHWPQCRVVLGGPYATLCPTHARGLGADLVVVGADLDPLWNFLGVAPCPEGLPAWDAYDKVPVGVLKLTEGCPFQCSYCSARQFHPEFTVRPLQRSLSELDLLVRCGASNVAFYDDALLMEPDRGIRPFLEEVIRRNLGLSFHTPNALHARGLTADMATLMVRAGVQTFFLGFENASRPWQEKTGGKVNQDDLARAVEALVRAGALPQRITAYVLMGHPLEDPSDVEDSMALVHSLGIRIMLAEFSPVPGTPDGDGAGPWVDVDEPLWHNKTAFTLQRLGQAEVERLKGLCRSWNEEVLGGPSKALQ